MSLWGLTCTDGYAARDHVWLHAQLQRGRKELPRLARLLGLLISIDGSAPLLHRRQELHCLARLLAFTTCLDVCIVRNHVWLQAYLAAVRKEPQRLVLLLVFPQALVLRCT